MGIYFPTNRYRHYHHLYVWKLILRTILHSIHLGMFSDKSVEYCFVRRIQAKPILSGWLQCRKDYAVYLKQDGTIFILYPTNFPWSKSDYYYHHHHTNHSMIHVHYGEENAIQIGPWHISASIIHDTKPNNSSTNHHHYHNNSIHENSSIHDPTTSPTCTMDESDDQCHLDEKKLLQLKAITSMETFMKGNIVYYLQVPS